jgi:hypothetical protein
MTVSLSPWSPSCFGDDRLAEQSQELAGVDAFLIRDVPKDLCGELVVCRFDKLYVQPDCPVSGSDHEPERADTLNRELTLCDKTNEDK